MDWKIDPKSGIRYTDPQNIDQAIFYVCYSKKVVSRGYAPMIYWYEERTVGPFVYAEAIKQLKYSGGRIISDKLLLSDSSKESPTWYPCWYNLSDYLNPTLNCNFIHYNL